MKFLFWPLLSTVRFSTIKAGLLLVRVSNIRTIHFIHIVHLFTFVGAIKIIKHICIIYIYIIYMIIYIYIYIWIRRNIEIHDWGLQDFYLLLNSHERNWWLPRYRNLTGESSRCTSIVYWNRMFQTNVEIMVFQFWVAKIQWTQINHPNLANLHFDGKKTLGFLWWKSP